MHFQAVTLAYYVGDGRWSEIKIKRCLKQQSASLISYVSGWKKHTAMQIYNEI